MRDPSGAPWRLTAPFVVGFLFAFVSTLSLRLIERSFVASNSTRADEGDPALFLLSKEPSGDCWGLSKQASHATPDKAQLMFNFPVTGKKALATLHFTAGEIGGPELVDITVNAVHQGFAKPAGAAVKHDVFEDGLVEQSIVLTQKHLRKNEKNLLVFDHIKNPPGHEPWVICHVWVEVEQLPEGPEAQLRQMAEEYLNRGDATYDRYQEARSMFDAWMAYKQARRFLEAMDEKVDDSDIVKVKIRASERELDEQCSKFLLKGQAMEQAGKRADAIANYKNGLLFFPEKEHPCFTQLRDRLAALE
jgi:hypothetical protein